MSCLSKRARFLLQLVIVIGDDFVVEQEVVVVLVHFGQDVRERFVHHIDDLLALEQLAVFLNGEIAVELVQNVLRVGRGLDAFLVIQRPTIHGVQHLAPLKLDGGVHPFVHEVSQRALGAAKTAVHAVPPVGRTASGDVNGRRVKFAGVPKTAGAAGARPNVLKHVAFMKAQLQMI